MLASSEGNLAGFRGTQPSSFCGEAFQVLEQSGMEGFTVLTEHLGQPVDPSGFEFLIFFIPFDGSPIRFL